MGLWGAAQAIAFALGGFLGTAAFDLARFILQDATVSYALVFGAEALLFLLAASLGANVRLPAAPASTRKGVVPTFADPSLVELAEGRPT